MTAASETKTCRQHPGGCRPWDRHVQPGRWSNELMAAVRAKAAEMGLSGNDGIEIALEEWVGWREPGEKWKGPRRQAPGERKRPAASKSAPGAIPFRAPAVKP